MTDAKDNHGAELVNRTVRAFDGLRKAAPRIIVLKGNHDYLRGGHMFFDFLSALDGIEVITKPTEDPDIDGPLTFFLPYSKEPEKEWAHLDFSIYDYLFMHQTVKGSRTSNGQIMEGRALPPLNAAKVYSGDIHVPQVVGGVEYVGSPYHVHLGDNFRPRCVLIERGGKAVDLHFDTVKRVSLRSTGLYQLAGQLRALKKGDHVKVTLELDASDRHDWRAVRRAVTAFIEKAGLVSQGVEMASAGATSRYEARSAAALSETPGKVLQRFVEAEGLPGDAYDAALDILETD